MMAGLPAELLSMNTLRFLSSAAGLFALDILPVPVRYQGPAAKPESAVVAL